MSTKHWSRVALLVLGWTIAGCNQPRPPISANAMPYGNYQQVYVDSIRLKENTNIDEPPKMARDEFGLLRVTVPIRSVIDRPFEIQYRVTFFDADHNPVSTQEWMDMPLTPNVPDQIHAVSPVPAADFRLDLRYPPENN